ncbi:MAG: DUF6263 family protein [Bacteroidales bacterium]|jgi:hypothetical protein|nr:DUF6263 family protein [Bacteroidales bacterium]
MKWFILRIGVPVTALMLSFPAFSQVSLKYTLKKGEVFKTNVMSEIDMLQKIMDQEVRFNFEYTMKSVFKVKEVINDGYVLEMRYTGIKMRTGVADKVIVFDSNDSETTDMQQNLNPVLKAMIDQPVEITMSRTGKIQSVEGFDAILEAMYNSSEGNIASAMQQQLKSQFGSPTSVQSFITQNYFPDHPVNTGDSWNFKETVNISNISIGVDVKQTLKRIEDEVIVLDMEGVISTPEGYETEVNGMKVKQSLNGTQKGETIMDRHTGWVVSSQITQTLEGKMEISGMNIPISATSIISITSD